MGAPAIRIDGVWKCYRHGLPREPTNLREAMVAALAGMLRPERERPPAATWHSAPSRWALRDVSLELAPGEIVGIVGRNGAGKSTLLKVLSRITPPTRGRIELRGQVASLLEVGTGFHPELTGRENVHLNGAILGMRRGATRARLDAIVAFAGLEAWIDTPVKRYSSGMQMRLAFAVAAHLDADILLVDEALAVGDAEFQRKCLSRLDHIARGDGRTVLMVSHNLAAIARLCERAVLLEAGAVVRDGPVRQVLDSYGRDASGEGGDLAARTDRTGSGAARLVAARVGWCRNGEPRQYAQLTIGGSAAARPLGVILAIYSADGACVLRVEGALAAMPGGVCRRRTVRVELPGGVALAPGSYHLNVALRDGRDSCDYVEHALRFEVRGDQVAHLGWSGRRDEAVCVQAAWREIAAAEATP